MTIPPKVRAWLVDVGERVGSSFGEAIVSAVAAGALAKGFNASTAHVLLMAGLMAAATTLKGILAAAVKRTVSPASLAPAQQPGQAEQDAPPGPASVPSGRAQPVAYTAPRPVRHDFGRRGLTVVTIPEIHAPGAGRLGRHVEHDERSRAFPIARSAGPLRSVSWKRRVPAFDQGPLGSCTGNAIAGVLSTAPFTHRFTEKRALTFYEAATRLDNVPGAYKPDDTGSTGIAACKAAQQAGFITSYLHAFGGVADVVHALQTGAGATGVNWYDSFDAPDSKGRITISPGAAVRGAHEFEIAGIQLATPGTFSGDDELECWQSWGQWGLHGRFYLRVRDLDRLLQEQGDFTQPVR